jgi:hypothetical protein
MYVIGERIAVGQHLGGDLRLGARLGGTRSARAVATSRLALTADWLRRDMARKAMARKVMTESISSVMTSATP